jgi:hypothetical protein
MQSSHSTHINHCRYSNHQHASWIQSLYSHYPLPLFKPRHPSSSPVNLIIIPTAAIQNTNSHHEYGHSTDINHCRYSNHQPPSMQSSHSTHINHCRNSNHQTPTCSPVTLLKINPAAIQTTKSHQAAQLHYSYNPLSLFKPRTSIMQSSQSTHNINCRYTNQQIPSWILLHYSHLPLPLFKSPTPNMQSSHSTHITHCRYSNHEHPSCSPVNHLIIITAAIQTNISHHVSGHSTQIKHCRSSIHQHPSCSPVTLLILTMPLFYPPNPNMNAVILLPSPTAGIQITNPHHVV